MTTLKQFSQQSTQRLTAPLEKTFTFPTCVWFKVLKWWIAAPRHNLQPAHYHSGSCQSPETSHMPARTEQETPSTGHPSVTRLRQSHPRSQFRVNPLEQWEDSGELSANSDSQPAGSNWPFQHWKTNCELALAHIWLPPLARLWGMGTRPHSLSINTSVLMTDSLSLCLIQAHIFFV